MEITVLFVVGVLAIIVVTALGARLGVAAPLILVALGVAVSFLPVVSAIQVDPEWILGGVLPPLLYSSAVSMPTMDFRRDFKIIGGLSVLLVAVTAVLIGYLLVLLLPGIGLATGIALGAIISPTDAVATKIAGRLGVSSRIIAVLEGESLLNDASALVILRSAVAATAVGISLAHVALDFVYAVVVAVAIGWIVGRLGLMLRARLHDAVLNTAASFVVPFVAYLPAEHLDASGLVAVVVAGLIAGHLGPRYLRPQDRRAEESNWRTVELLLEGGVFLLMGLELYGLVDEVRNEHSSLWTAVWVGGVAALGVLAVRALFLTPVLYRVRSDRKDLPNVRVQLEAAQERLDAGFKAFTEADLRHNPVRSRWQRLRHRAGALTDEHREVRRGRIQKFIDRRFADIDYLLAEPLGRKQGVVLVWAGMRGVVTLAAAQSLPADTPKRALLILVAFVVAATSLGVQGGTLPFVVRLLKFDTSDDIGSRAERERLITELTRVATRECDRSDLLRPNGSAYHPQVVAMARDASTRLIDENGFDLVPGTDSTRYEQYRELRLAVLRAERDALLEARSVGSYSSQVLGDALAVLDADEISLALRGAGDD